MTPAMPRIGIVVPVYGNQESLRQLYERLSKAVEGMGAEVVFQFVNDHSPDASQEVLEELARQDPRVRVAVLSKNHGSFVAIVAGLSLLKDCDAAAFISADLQDPPEVIPQMVESWRSGKKVVLCARRLRDDPLLSKLFSALYYKMYRWLVMPSMPPAGFDFALMDRQVIDLILASSEKRSSLPSLILWAGFEREYIYYDRQKRPHGKSRWSFKKKINYAVDSVVSFSARPLRIISMMGVLLAAACLAGMLATIISYVFGGVRVAGWTSLILVVLFIGAFTFISLGVIGEYLWNNLEQTRRRPLFIVDKMITCSSPEPGEAGQAVAFFDARAVSSPVQAGLSSAFQRVLKGNHLILGPEVERLERSLALFLGCRQVVGVASGTDAITLALLAGGLKPGDIVAVPALSAPATAVAVQRAGGRPLFVDVEPEHLLMSPTDLARAMKRWPVKAVVSVHLYGNPCDMAAINDLALHSGALVVEDCAQSLGGTLDGKPLGSLSRAGAFSFYPTKNLGAYGDGGAVATDDLELAERLRSMRFYGLDERGMCVRPGLNSRLDELQAALLGERLRVIEEHNRRRGEITAQYDQALGFLSPVPSRPGRVTHLYVLRPDQRERLRGHLSGQGVVTVVHYPFSLNAHPQFADPELANPCPVAEQACGRVVSLPCHPGLTDQQVAQVILACQGWQELHGPGRA